MASDLSDVYIRLIEELRDLGVCSGAAVLLPRGDKIVVAAQVGPRPLPQFVDLSLAERELLDRLALTGRALRQPVAPDHAPPLPAPAAAGEWIGVPLLISARMHGCLSIVGQFRDGDENLILALARQTALALGWAARAELAQRGALPARRLLRVVDRVSQASDPLSALELVLEEATSFTGATHGCVLASELGRAAPIAFHGYSQDEESLLQQIPPSFDRGVLGQAFRRRVPVRSDDILDDPAALPALSGTRSQLVIPICANAHVLGVLDLQSPRTGAFRDVDEEWMRALAALGVWAIAGKGSQQPQPGTLEGTAKHDVGMSSRLAIVTDLAAGVAHEINNPLTTILGYTHLLLRDQSLPQPTRDDIAHIMFESQRIATLVDRFLRFARPTSGAKRPLSIAEPLAEALALLERRLQESDIQVEIDQPAESPMILGQLGQLEQAFIDLIENAIEAIGTSDRRRISILVRQQGDWAQVAISDTGRGIRPDLQKRVFEPGFTTKVDRGIARGLGLGLYATHMIIREHWGRIEVESELWRGSSFTVFLPAI